MRFPTGKLSAKALRGSGPLPPLPPAPAPAPPRPPVAAAPAPAVDPSELARLSELQSVGASALGVMPWDAPAQAASPIQAAIDAQIARPDSIAQARPNTCTATAMQIMLATKDPKCYKAVVTDLLSQGRATLPNGAVLELSAANQTYMNSQNLSPAQKIDMAFQAAAMDLGNGEFNYSLATDKSTMINPDYEPEDLALTAGAQKTQFLKNRQLQQVGLSAEQLGNLNKVFGDIPRFTAPPEAKKAEDPVGATLDALRGFLDANDGKPSVIAVLGQHAVAVAAVDTKARTVSLLDGYGHTQMPGAQFYDLLNRAGFSGIGNDTTMKTTSTAPPSPPPPRRR